MILTDADTGSDHPLPRRHRRGSRCSKPDGVSSRLSARPVGAADRGHVHQGVNREHPILSAAQPGGGRIQVVLPPATRGQVAMAIRKHVSPDLRLTDCVRSGP